MTQFADIEVMEELHHREDNEIAVSLLWSRHSKAPQRPWTNRVGDAEVQLEQLRAVEAPGITHVKYRVVT